MFTPISQFLKKAVQQAGIGGQVEAAMVLDKFSEVAEELLGKEISSRVKPLYLRNRVLTIACLSSVLAQELQLRQNKIINRINEHWQRNIVDKIQFLS